MKLTDDAGGMMSLTSILEPARETPLVHKTGVLVVGSDPAGLAAGSKALHGIATSKPSKQTVSAASLKSALKQ